MITLRRPNGSATKNKFTNFMENGNATKTILLDFPRDPK